MTAPAGRPAAAARDRRARAVSRSSGVARQAAADRIQPQQKTRGDGRRLGVAPGARDQHLRRAQRAGEIVRGKPDAGLERRHPERRANLGRQPRIGRGKRRPHAFVQSAEDHEVGALQPRFEQAPDEDARMPAIGRPHRLRVEQLAQQRHRIFGGDRQPLRRFGRLQFGQRSAAMRPAGPRHAASPASALRRIAIALARSRASDMRLQQAVRRAFNPRPNALPLARGAEMRVETGEPGRRPWTAELEVQLAHRIEPGKPLFALSAHQRMLEQRQQRRPARAPPRQRSQCRAATCRGAVADSGLPALSSASIPQRASRAETRPASWRSGVTSAAVLPGISSASRSARAIACASAAESGSSARRIPLSRRSAGRKRLPFVGEVGAAMALATARPRAGDEAPPPDQRHCCTSPRATPSRSSRSFRWNCGWLASPRPSSSGPSASHSSSGKMFEATVPAGRPCLRASAPRGRSARPQPERRW